MAKDGISQYCARHTIEIVTISDTKRDREADSTISNSKSPIIDEIEDDDFDIPPPVNKKPNLVYSTRDIHAVNSPSKVKPRVIIAPVTYRSPKVKFARSFANRFAPIFAPSSVSNSVSNSASKSATSSVSNSASKSATSSATSFASGSATSFAPKLDIGSVVDEPRQTFTIEVDRQFVLTCAKIAKQLSTDT